MPSTATRSPAFAGELRRALNVVRPAQSSGAALIDESSSGTDMSPLALAIITFRVASILLDAGVGLVLTAHEVAGAAGDAVSAAAAEKPHADTLADCPTFDAFTERIRPDRPPRGRAHAAILWEHPFHRAGVRMADPAGLDADADVTWRGSSSGFSVSSSLPGRMACTAR